MPRLSFPLPVAAAVAAVAAVAAPAAVTPPDQLAAPPGFRVDLVAAAGPADGSWISLAVDPAGRLLIGGQKGQPVVRVTVADGRATAVDKLDLGVTEVMGAVWAHDSLYLMGGGRGLTYGLFRCRDADADGTFEDVRPLAELGQNGEHGAHAVVPGPDGKLYIPVGNFVNRKPDRVSGHSPHKNYREDLLLPRQWDGNGHAAGLLAPGGRVLRTDPDGKDWEVVAGGLRNAYDLAFNADGELFTYDSDMEWDWGMPWYRPTRLLHVTSAAEFGWRSGTGKWPAYYPDSLPAAADVGLGSPTGVCTGAGLKFPARYQRAVYLCDWTFGRLLAAHLTPNGASYTAAVEPLVAHTGQTDPKAQHRRPLNLTDAVVHPDGALYFTVGGRGIQAALYRLVYVGDEPTAPADLRNRDGELARRLRRSLEAFHGRADPAAVAAAWPHLGSTDRFIRYAARIAVEAQPAAEWKAKAVSEADPLAGLTALLALARCGTAADLPDVLAALDKFPLAGLPDPLKLDKLRAWQVAFARHGRPPAAAGRKVLAEVDALFPGGDEAIDREAFQLLVYLNAPSAVADGLAKMAAAGTTEERMFYLFHLRTVPIGYWTLDQRKAYLSYYRKGHPGLARRPDLARWFAEAGRGYAVGNSFGPFLRNFAREFADHLAADERAALAADLAAVDQSLTAVVEAKPRPFVRRWQPADLADAADAPLRGRDFAAGKRAFADAQCAKCHRVGDWGGAVGPELTAVAARYDRRALVESILEPSKVVSDQYQNESLVSADGRAVTGRVVDESAETVSVQPDPLSPVRVVVAKADLESRKPSPVSPMPAGLCDGLTRDDLLDLLAFLESGGNKDHPAFRR